ncbi:hypothetical protein EZV76_15840 [Flagellimonas alvinocaridis]|jgi:hypothetical protein|uniref:Uncharacterized protein n=1 Tax=Flagellimonas alvinocaridis TaxID=2530200 RepID=A0A4S8RFN4_9FLAO|nr:MULTISPECIES: hypothetical protein [Allomuricauda]THV57087.1 hypothetical protein EZV76_15840 [Allomuricauda alvinocaridis]
MKLASANAANELTFEVDIPSQGLIFSNGFPTGATVKVDLVTANANDVNRIPEVAYSHIFDLNTYLGLDRFRSYSAGTSTYQNSPLLFFSASGVLLFDDDTKYKVTLTNLGGATFDVYNMDNAKMGEPIVIKKAELRSTQAERTENYEHVDFLLFNGDHTPDKITYLVSDGLGNGQKKVRKVEISAEQMRAYKNSFELSQLEVDDTAYSNGVGQQGFPIEELDAITIHHDTSLDEDMAYLTVDYKPKRVIR